MEKSDITSEKNKEIHQNETMNLLSNIKSPNVLKNILFSYCIKFKSLNLLKKNKMLQTRINLSIKDYKEYSEYLSRIEIEIIPIKNSIGSFINIMSQVDEPYFHIYFNNSQTELQRYFFNKKDRVIKIIIEHQVKSFYGLFQNCQSIESIVFKKFYRKDTINMSNMFYKCQSLKKLETFAISSSITIQSHRAGRT